MYKIISLHDEKKWLDIINSFREVDVYYHPKYLKAFMDNGDGKPVLFYFENEHGRVANVFLKRDIYQDERLRMNLSPNTFYDVSTVYGYGGPIYDSVNFEKLKIHYGQEFSKFCKDMNIISEFTRFHPVLKNHIFLENICEVEKLRTTVYMDLSQGEQFLWEDLDCKARNNIRKAQRANINIVFGREKFLIDEFKRLYKYTMDRHETSSYYYFNEKFFYTTIDELNENALIFAARYKDEIIAASIIIFSKEYVHCHFLASDINYQNLRATNLLIYEVGKWGCGEGKKILHLGGGARDDDDKLLRFKKTFSKSNRLSFYVGKKIYNETIYNELIRKRTIYDKCFDLNSTYFPKYRA